MKVSKKSFWDQLYCFPNVHQYDNINICVYVRGILRGILVALAAVLVGTAIGYIVLAPYAVGIMTAITGKFVPDVGLFGMSILMHLAFAWAAFQVWRENRPWKAPKESPKPKTPSFLTIWYKSVKEKTCFLIERE